MWLGWVAAGFYWAYALGVLVYLKHHWNDENKKNTRISELVSTVLMVIVGSYILLLYRDPAVTPRGTQLGYGIILVFAGAITLFLLVNHYRGIQGFRKYGLTNDPVMTRDYTQFLSLVAEKYCKDHSKDDIIKDLSRKMLHIIVLAVLIVVHMGSVHYAAQISELGLTPMAYRNTIYIAISTAFIFLFTYADTLRMTRFNELPDWARKWYCKSMDERKEPWTYISSIPFLLALLLLIFLPVQILFTAGMISCLADAAASVVGKHFGKHKLTTIGIYPHKSVEGLVAGIFAGFISVFFVFEMWPYPGMTLMLQLAIALGAALSFAYADLYGQYLADNMLNNLLPALTTLVLLWIF